MEELRKVFYKTMAEMMDENPQVVYLDADLAGAMGTAGLFQEFPQQAFDMGIMEANMIGVAAGMSIKGKIPFVHSFGPFASRRCADQTFLSGCYNKANLKIIGSDPGITAETNGGTHMPFEDVGIYRSFPGMTIMDIDELISPPGDPEENGKYLWCDVSALPKKKERPFTIPAQKNFRLAKEIL